MPGIRFSNWSNPTTKSAFSAGLVPALLLLGLFSLPNQAYASDAREQGGENPEDTKAMPYETAFALSEVDAPPRITFMAPRFYPTSAKGDRIQGEVTVKFIVTKDGKVVEPMVVEAEPEGIFDSYALNAVKRWRYKPAIKNGEKVDVILVEPIEFKQPEGGLQDYQSMAADTVYNLYEVEKAPYTIKEAGAVYPASAMSQHIEGSVTLRYVVTKGGRVVDPVVVRGDPPKIFDQSAIDAVLKWEYKPGERYGKPVDVAIVMPFEFKILGGTKREPPLNTRSMPFMTQRIYKKGYEHFSAGKYEKALKAFEKVTKQVPYNAAAFNSRGLSLNKLGKTDEAIEDYSKAIILDQRLRDAYMNRGLAYVELGELQKAIKDYTRFIILDQKDLRGYIARALAYDKMGSREKACRDLAKACELGNCKILERARERGVCKEAADTGW